MPKQWRVDITSASIDELRKFADSLGIKLITNQATSRDKIMEAIRTLWDNDFIMVTEEAADEAADDAPTATFPAETLAPPAPVARVETVPAAPAKSVDRLDTDSSKDPRITIEVHRLPVNSGPQGGDRPVPVGVNGIQMLIPRGKPVTIPYRYYLALKDAVRTEGEMVVDPITRQEELVTRDVQSFPFNVIKAPPRDELIAWYRDNGRRIPDDLLAAA